MAKNKYHLFGGFYCAELEAVCHCILFIRSWNKFRINRILVNG